MAVYRNHRPAIEVNRPYLRFSRLSPLRLQPSHHLLGNISNRQARAVANPVAPLESLLRLPSPAAPIQNLRQWIRDREHPNKRISRLFTVR
jgi:hypothetical protein